MSLTINQQVTPVISLALSAPFRWDEYQDSQTPQDGSLLVLLVDEAALPDIGDAHHQHRAERLEERVARPHVELLGHLVNYRGQARVFSLPAICPDNIDQVIT